MSKKSYKEILQGSMEGDEACITVQDLKDQGVPINKIPTNTGLANTPVCRVPFSYNTPQGASQLENQGAYIVFGQVPHGATNTTGYGKDGVPADSIDLVVGRNSSLNKGKGPKKNSVVENNVGLDAARIYISRLTDIDYAFGLVSSQNEGRGLIGRSGIGIKADGVRIIGREGVKITTGAMHNFKNRRKGEQNSQGGDLSMVAPKIELVAGNNISNLQGVALGDNTARCLRQLHNIIGQIWGAVFNMGVTQAGLNGVLGVTPFAWHSAAVTPAVQKQLTGVLTSLYVTRILATHWENNYLKPNGGGYIESPNVKTN